MEGERFGFSSDAIKWGFPRMSHGFVLLTDRASFDIICYPLFHSRPLGILTCLSKGFISARVSGGRVVVVNSHQGVLFEEGEVTLDPIGFEFVFGDQHYILIVSVSVVCSWRAR